MNLHKHILEAVENITSSTLNQWSLIDKGSTDLDVVASLAAGTSDVAEQARTGFPVAGGQRDQSNAKHGLQA